MPRIDQRFPEEMQKASMSARLWVCAVVGLLVAGHHSKLSADDVTMPRPESATPIRIVAQKAQRWRQGIYEILVAQGNVQLTQGDQSATSKEAVFWIDRSEPTSDRPTKVIAYFDGDVTVTDVSADGHLQKLVDANYLYRYLTRSRVDLRITSIRDVAPGMMARQRPPAVYDRGLVRRSPQLALPVGDGAVRQAQFAGGISSDDISASSVVITPRNGTGLDYRMLDQQPGIDETVAIATGGIRLEIRDVTIDGAAPDLQSLGTIEIEADSAVLWTRGLGGSDSGDSESGQKFNPRQAPWEIYLEGNIVFLQGRRAIYAERMYYDVQKKRGVIRDTEMLAPVKDYEGLLRLKADVLQMVDQQHFEAYGAAITSSLIGHPRYWLQSGQITIEDEQVVRTDPQTGVPAIDPISGRLDVDHNLLASSRNNFVYVGGWPIFYWPTLATDLRKPTYYLDNMRIKNDNVFGTQFFADWDTFQVFGISKPPEGVDWTFSTDYLSDRGFAGGTHVEYNRPESVAFFGANRGLFDAWGIDDHGVDNLGWDRRALQPEKDFRGRILARHRHELPFDIQLSSELGYISDRDFLEQYLENEWDQEKDQTTGIELKKYLNHQTIDLAASAHVNDFFTQTEWMPRLDHHILGHSFLANRLTWNAHSQVGYGRISNATVPQDPANLMKFDWLAWEEFNTPAGQDDREGVRAATRHEFNLPLDFGPIRLVPYLLGEAAYWHEDIAGDDVTRLYGQTGVRASLPMWTVDPTVRNTLFNLKGLAHKVTWEAEILYSDVDQDLSRLTLYDPLDDDAIEFARRRFLIDTFGLLPGANVPLQFDERYYAHRSGMQSWVSAPSTEIAEDLMMARMAIRQRWQTKRGMPGRERTVDWITFDVEGSFFPKPGRDNFGQNLGMLNYDFRWHIGDRLALLSDGYADLFIDGLRTVSAGGLISQPGKGRLYLGFRSIDGPITSNVINGSLSYRMSEKWIFTGGASYDLGPTGNIGQSFGLTRIGESTLARFGFNIDESRNSFGVRFNIEPRFLPSNRMGEVAGLRIPPAGAHRLE
ncbi:MAG TPA: organic solvent tolerance protein OstA [Planctomycetes bacterium]|nr:organic solvent tolerance protein OstA [Planctomycetaceae bacterium]HIM31658.1 organic solvent tolerance protein OstA [Planctomycetota bacterium]